MLANDSKTVAEDLGGILDRTTCFEQFRGERLPETMRMSASDTARSLSDGSGEWDCFSCLSLTRGCLSRR